MKKQSIYPFRKAIMSTTKLKITCLVVALTIILLAACGQPEFAPDEPTPRLNEETQPSAELGLLNGNTISFYHIESSDDTLILESGGASKVSGLGVLTLALDTTPEDVAAFDVYWAFSEPASEIPTFLNSSGLTPQSSPQGWAQEKLGTASSGSLLEPQGSQVACNNYTFLTTFFKHHQRGKSFFALDQTAKFSSHFSPIWRKFVDTAWEWRYFMKVSVTTDKWYGSLCGHALQTSYNNHWVKHADNTYEYIGPYLQFLYSTGNGWQTIASKEIPANQTHWYHYIWNSTALSGRRLAIQEAEAFDSFDIAMDTYWNF